MRFLILFIAVAISQYFNIETGAPAWAVVIIGANTLLNPNVIAKETAFQVHNHLVLGNRVHRDFVDEFKNVGDTVTYQKPVRYLANDGADITSQIQDITENSDTIVINKRKNVAMQYTSKELSLDIKEFSRKHIMPASEALANKIDEDGCGLYQDVYNGAGTVGSNPTFSDLLAVGQKMTEFAVPKTNRNLVLNPAGEWNLPTDLKGILQPSMVKGLIAEASIGRAAKFDIFGDQNIKTHTAGVPGGTPLINGAGQTGSTIAVDGLTITTGNYKKGDIITLAGVNAVNPISKVSTGSLQQFTVTADATADGAGAIAALGISPAITVTGAYQTVSGSPADGAAITLVASSAANLAFHPNAFSLVTIPIRVPDGAAWGVRQTYKGVSVRLVKGYNVLTDVETVRLDVMYGWKASNPELACRLFG